MGEYQNVSAGLTFSAPGRQLEARLQILGEAGFMDGPEVPRVRFYANGSATPSAGPSL